MQLELPGVEDDPINTMLSGLNSPTNISIRGIPGSGKTIFAEHLIAAAVSSDQACRLVLLEGKDGGREVLNQATGVGIGFLPNLPTGLLAVKNLETPTIREVCQSLTHYPGADLIVIDSLDNVPNIGVYQLDRLLAWLATEVETSLITIGEDGVGDSRSYADLVVDFEQLGGDEDFLYADSVLTIETPGEDNRETRAFRIEGYTVKFREAG